MKKLLTTLIAIGCLVIAQTAHGQLSVPLGGTGRTSTPFDYVLVGSSTGKMGAKALVAGTNVTITTTTNSFTFNSSYTETDPIWSAFLLDPIFTNLTSTNFFATNTLFINASSTNLFADALTFTNASGTMITSTSAYFTKILINTTTQLGTVTLQGVAGTNPLSIVSSSGSSLFQVNQNATAGFNTTSQAYALTIQQTDTSKPLLLLQGDSAGLQDLFVVKGFGGQTVSINAAGSYVGPFIADTGLSVALSILSPPNRRLGFNFGSTAGVYWGSTALYSAAKDVGISRVSSGVIGVGDSTVGGFSATLAAGKIGIGTSTPANSLVVIGTSTFDGAIFQTNLTDCDASNQTVAYDLTTGQFSCGTDDTSEQRVGTSTANYFTFYDSATSVTGTSWMTFANGALTVTTNTNFIIVSSTSGLFENATTTNLGVTNIYGNPNVTIPSGYLYISSAGGLYVQNTASFRGNVRNDSGANLTITGGTSGNTNFTGTISVVGTSTLATTTVTNLIFTIATGTSLTSTNAFFTNLTFTNATGTVLYLSSALNINNALTINSVGDVSASGTLRVFGTATFGAETNEVFVRNLYRAVNSTSTIVDYSSDPDNLSRGTGVATTLAVYSDDITRILVQNTAAGASGVVSLKNKSLTPANTNLDSTYNNAGTLQSITASTLSGGGGAATVRGALTYQGYHYLMVCNGGTCTIKRATSTWDNDLSVLANWADATVSGSFDGSMLGLIGAYNGNIYMASNTDDILPYAITTSTNTLTAGTPVNIALNHSLNCTRVNDNGIMTGCDGVPQLQFYNHSGTRLYPFGAGLGASAPATAGPSIFVTRKSNYIINGSATALTKLNFVLTN